MFITMVLAERRPLFGQVVHDKVVLSPAGEILAEQIRRVITEFPAIHVCSDQIMPDHYHVRLWFAPGIPEPLKEIGNFVGRIKQYSQFYIQQDGHCGTGLWEKGYHDHICLSAFIDSQVDKYIKNNPLKWHLMYGGGCVRVQEPMFSERLPADEWWSGVGATSLMDEGQKLCAVQLSRRIKEHDYNQVLARLLTATEKGYVFAGTFISPLEQRLYSELVARNLPVVRAVPDPLAMVYRPKGDEPQQFDGGKLLLLSRQVAADSRYDAWHGINAALGEMARQAGDDLYVRPSRTTGQLRWLFNDAATRERAAVKAG